MFNHVPKARPTGSELVYGVRFGELDVTRPNRGCLGVANGWVVPRGDVREHQPPYSPGVHGSLRRPAAGQVNPLRFVATVDERRVRQDQSRVVEQNSQAIAGVRVAGVGQHLAVSLDADSVGLCRVADHVWRNDEGPDPNSRTIDELTEVELIVHAVRRRHVTSADHPFVRAPGAVNGNPGARTNGWSALVT